ncbi:PH domain-containing protein [Prosthecobacter sp. SYSU 5D2]|uniref:PH domain-containing protein n=1 Tax=Prosthecobacter sp. SYSU 5D2 TaxID=3134134 RepID=UPI0031FE50E4
MRYRLHEHPAFPGLLSKEDLFLLVERGSLARGDLCADTVTGRDHTVGDVIGDMRAARARAGAQIERPMFREIRADAPGEMEEDLPWEEDDDDTGELPLDEGQFTLAGELILHRSHPAWLGAGKSLFLVFLLGITTWMLLQIQPDYALLSGVCAGGVLMAVWVARATRVYVVTEERVEVVWGILGRSSKEVRICDIRSIDVYESGLKGLLGLGTVDFSSAANSGIEVQFRDIRGAHAVKELVRKLQRGQGKRED